MKATIKSSTNQSMRLIGGSLLCFFMLLRTMSALSSSTCKTGPAALIFLHGLGDTPAGWSMLQHELPNLQPRLKELKYVFPSAPTIPITINGGMSMPGWFDVLDWPIGIAARDDKEGMLKAVQQVETATKKLEEQGIPKNRIVVGGFSQGGAIAILAAYRSAENPYAACAAMSGWLTLSKELKVGAASATPLFWGHGTQDDKVLFEQQAHGVKLLKEQGVDVKDSSYPIGHGSHPEETKAFASFLDEVLFGEQEK